MNGEGEASTEKKEARTGLIADVESRLQFNTFVSIFFGTPFYTFGHLLNQPEADASKILLHWAALPIYYILSYAIFGLFKSLIPKSG
jgi:hypothetical protein